MTYEIKISGTDQDNGKIELDRLIDLAYSLKQIATGALQIRLFGVSSNKGRKTDQVTKALKIKLSDLKKGSTVLELECEPFKTSAIGKQRNLFNSEISEILPNQTPIGLVIETFKEALQQKDEVAYLDKPLLKKLKAFEKIFISPSETITFSNKGSISDFQLHKKDFKKIKVLEESMPEPQEIIINGIVDELKYSKLRVSIATKEGSVHGVLNDENFEPESISKYWGKEVTIAGSAYYHPNGKMSFIYIERIFEPAQADKYFSKLSKKETVEQQILRQQKQLKNQNNLADIVGQWPGDESIEEILNTLD